MNSGHDLDLAKDLSWVNWVEFDCNVPILASLDNIPDIIIDQDRLDWLQGVFCVALVPAVELVNGSFKLCLETTHTQNRRYQSSTVK